MISTGPDVNDPAMINIMGRVVTEQATAHYVNRAALFNCNMFQSHALNELKTWCYNILSIKVARNRSPPMIN